jgi:hypothetical protein
MLLWTKNMKKLLCISTLAQILKLDEKEIHAIINKQSTNTLSLIEAQRLFQNEPEKSARASHRAWCHVAYRELHKMKTSDEFLMLYPNIPLELRGFALEQALKKVASSLHCKVLYKEAEFEGYCGVEVKIAILKKWIKLTEHPDELKEIQTIAHVEEFRETEELSLKKQLKLVTEFERLWEIYQQANSLIAIKILAMRKMLKFV